MSPHTSADTASALSMLRTAARDDRPFDVAVVDQHLTEADGHAFLETIATDQSVRDVDVIVLTSGSYAADRGAKWAGAADVLPKPVRMSKLYNSLVQLLDDGSAAELDRRAKASKAVAVSGARAEPSSWPRTMTSIRWSPSAP
jgi:CheY-like chemotaxis protein